MISVQKQILQKIKAQPKASTFTTQDFLGIANRVNVDKALSSLVKDSVLRRLTQGIYDHPITDPKLGLLPPDLNQVMDAIKRQSGHQLQVDGAKAANMLGLSTQVPAQTIYLTDGHSRNIKIGHWVIKLKHASPKMLAGAGHIAGYILQALRYLGKQNTDDAVIHKIQRLLSKKDRQQLKQLIPYAPSWAYNTLQLIIMDKK